LFPEKLLDDVHSVDEAVKPIEDQMFLQSKGLFTRPISERDFAVS
jgi:hypothetical protein